MAVAKQESKSDSSPEGEESSSSRSASPAPKVKRESSSAPNVKREAESSGGESESEEEESGSASGSDEGASGSEKEESGSSEEKEGDKMETDAPAEVQSNKKSTVTFGQPQTFKPPTGFKSAKKQSSSSNVSSLLSNLNGKQVFHITAPSFLPLSKVKEISLAKVMQGEPVLKHDGANYGIPMDSISQGEADGKTLFLHDPKSQLYYNTPASNIQSYHVQELICLPETTGPTSISAQDYEKPPRKQPKNLKMRFRPVGSGNAPPETIGTSDEESDEEKPTFKMPKDVKQEKEEKKRKHHHAEDDGHASRKKSKKHGGDKMDVDEKEKKKSSKSKDEKKRKEEKA